MKRIAVVAVAAGATLWFAAVPAQAHSELRGSTPAADTAVDDPPRSVELVFGQTIRTTFATVTVGGADGMQWGMGAPIVTGDRVRMALQEGMTPGQYTVGYRVISRDDDPITGSYTFLLAVPGEVPPAAGPPTESDSSTTVLLLFGGVAALLFVGGIVLILRGDRRRRAETTSRLHRIRI